MRTTILVPLSIALLCACGDPKPAGDPRYPPLPVGCSVQVYADAPPMQTDNIGTVTAWCTEGTAPADCLQTLKDQTCKLGGDIVWGVPEKPETKDGKTRLYGRAAHTKK